MKGTVFNIQKFCLHDGPGIRTTVFFKGCNLRCSWCANPESQCAEVQMTLDAEKCAGCGKCAAVCPAGARTMQNGRPTLHSKTCTLCGLCMNACPVQAIGQEGSKMDMEKIISEVIKDKPFYDHSGGGVTFSGGEPLMQMEFAGSLADALHEKGISVAVETAGCIAPEKFRDFLSKLDFIHIDLKHYESERHRRGTGIGNELVIDNIRTVQKSGLPFMVRIPVIPGFNNSADDARGFARLLRSLEIDRVQLLPFHQMGAKKYELLGKEYAFKGVSQLHSEDLSVYKEIFEQHGVHAEI